jgi:choline dehydrogenase-like flavoprotein
VVTNLIYDAQKQRASRVRVVDAVTLEEREYFARIVFVCASAIASTAILLNSVSERFPEGMGNDSSQLGHNLMDHHFRIGASGGWQRKVAEFAFGASLKEELTKPGLWTMGLVGFGEHLPDYKNRMYLDQIKKDKHGMPMVVFDVAYGENERKMRIDMINDAQEMIEKAGLMNVKPYDNGAVPGQSIHEMGTARMGNDPKTSVLNAYNQVHQVKNVFVTDGACMSSSSCVNPSLTYMAITARAADFAVRELKAQRL